MIAMYEIAAATAVKLVIDYLRRRLAPGQPESAAAAKLYDLVREHVPTASVWQRLVHESVTNTLQRSTVNMAEQALAGALYADSGFASQLQESLGQTGHDISPPSANQRIDVHNERKFAGAVVHGNLTDKSKVGTRIAIGGGGSAILAAALIFIWHSFSAADGKSSELKAYRSAVVSTCDRIRTTGTFQFSWHSDAGGVYVLRSDLLAKLEQNRQVVREQTAALAEKPAPDTLSAAKDEVAKAAAAVDNAYPRATARVRKLPSKISIERLQVFATETTMDKLTQSYRHLGDTLTRLAGTTCAIEAPTATN